jgi:soluble lytic murein transglycosylase-like protein
VKKSVDRPQKFKYLYPMKKIIVALLLSVSAQAANLDGFFAALAKVESSGNAKAVNKKETALGIYQIRPGYFKDSRVKGNHEQVFNPTFARSVCEAYFKRYAPEAYAKGDFESLARLHNMGPKYKKNPSATNGYWSKIQKNLK